MVLNASTLAPYGWRFKEWALAVANIGMSTWRITWIAAASCTQKTPTWPMAVQCFNAMEGF